MPLIQKPPGKKERFLIGILIFAMALLLVARGYRAGQTLKKADKPAAESRP